MARYRMDDGTIINTAKALESWEEATRWDGRNHVSIATGSQWEHETLYKSAKSRYYIECISQWQGSTPSTRWVDQTEAAAWLLLNSHPIPEDLQAAAVDVEE